jgi:hypothetical protein
VAIIKWLLKLITLMNLLDLRNIICLPDPALNRKEELSVCADFGKKNLEIDISVKCPCPMLGERNICFYPQFVVRREGENSKKVVAAKLLQ